MLVGGIQWQADRHCGCDSVPDTQRLEASASPGCSAGLSGDRSGNVATRLGGRILPGARLGCEYSYIDASIE